MKVNETEITREELYATMLDLERENGTLRRFSQDCRQTIETLQKENAALKAQIKELEDDDFRLEMMKKHPHTSHLTISEIRSLLKDVRKDMI